MRVKGNRSVLRSVDVCLPVKGSRCVLRATEVKSQNPFEIHHFSMSLEFLFNTDKFVFLYLIFPSLQFNVLLVIPLQHE